MLFFLCVCAGGSCPPPDPPCRPSETSWAPPGCLWRWQPRAMDAAGAIFGGSQMGASNAAARGTGNLLLVLPPSSGMTLGGELHPSPPRRRRRSGNKNPSPGSPGRPAGPWEVTARLLPVPGERGIPIVLRGFIWGQDGFLTPKPHGGGSDGR